MKTLAVASVSGEMRMRTLFTTLLLAACFSLLVSDSPNAMAQNPGRMEAGASYSFVNTNAPPGGCGCFSMNGGTGWSGYGIGRGLAVVGEIGSQYAGNINHTSADLTLTSFLFGPRLTWHRSHRFAPFGQLLLGGAHASGALTPTPTGFASSANAFAMATGGGVDIALTRHVVVRLVQVDYYLTRFDNGTNDHQNNIRVGEGVVFRFGPER